VLYTLVP
jgi:hypothetical protein